MVFNQYLLAVDIMQYLPLLQRPDCQFIAVGVCEVESPATRKAKDILYYSTSC